MTNAIKEHYDAGGVRVAFYQPGDHHLTYAGLPIVEALELFRELKRPGSNRGWSPELIAPQWRAHLGEDKRTGRPRWSMKFESDDGYKSSACCIAEHCGVRYASHRRGYQASERAFGKFIARMLELELLV